MTDRLNDIQQAIDNFQMDEARRLLRDELQENPSANGYYLASQAAKNHGQRIQCLEKTIELDPFHQAAHDELASIMPPQMDAPAMPTTSPIVKPKTKNSPNYRFASVSKRFLALIIDSIILGILGAIAGGILGVSYAPAVAGNDIANQEAFIQLQTTAMMIGIFINGVYYVFFMTRTNGQTPGKQLLKIRAVKKDGKPFTIMDAIVRNVIGYWLSGLFLIGYLWAIFDSEKQGWHDKIAGTVVIEE